MHISIHPLTFHYRYSDGDTQPYKPSGASISETTSNEGTTQRHLNGPAGKSQLPAKLTWTKQNPSMDSKRPSKSYSPATALPPRHYGTGTTLLWKKFSWELRGQQLRDYEEFGDKQHIPKLRCLREYALMLL